MSVEVRVPELGESITEAVVVRWLKDDGAAVRAEEPLLELETDKSALEVVAPAAGRLTIRAPTGARVRVGAVIGEIAEDVAARAEPAPPPRAERPHAPAAPGPVAELSRPSAPPPRPASERPRPVVVDNGGRGAERVAVAAPAPPAPASPAAPPATRRAPASADEDVERVPMSELRRTIARRLVEAQRTAAILTTFNEIDVGELQALRARSRERFRARHGVDLGLMSLFARATVLALREVTIVNVPPCRSAGASRLARARPASSPIARSRPATSSPSAPRTTGTTRPRAVLTAMPRCTRR